MTRDEKIARARQMREGGARLREIAEAVGVAQATVYRWLNPASAERQRQQSRAAKERRRGICRECGGPTGYETPHGPCGTCNLARQHEERFWTRERVIEWIRAYVAQTGEVPPSSVCTRGHGAPHVDAVSREFPDRRWAEAVWAAGFEPHKPTMLGRGHTAERRDEIVARARAGETVAEIGRALGLGRTTIEWHLDRAGESRRRREDVAAAREDRARLYERLWAAGLTCAQIAEQIGCGRETVGSNIKRYRELGYDLPLRRNRRAVAA